LGPVGFTITTTTVDFSQNLNNLISFVTTMQSIDSVTRYLKGIVAKFVQKWPKSARKRNPPYD